jgi:cytochrome d ubiquinol oxidase subunit I
MFSLIYLLLFILFIYLLNKKIKHGPDDLDTEQHRPAQAEMVNMLNPKPSKP